ncbi:MAG TPA: DNA polymerase III subunit delta [Candidatus Limnocylindria bacterium]|nr:DNA polymerase III subunit delta [Candidatus Limnocylindria bacterium]
MTGVTQAQPRLAYFWGQDAYSLERAARDLGAQLEAAGGQPVETWRTSGDDEAGAAGTGGEGAAKRRARLFEQLEQRLGTASLFGAGILVVLRQPAVLARESAARQRLAALLPNVAPGNALCLLELQPSGVKPPAHSSQLREMVESAGGQVREFPALSRDRMEAFLETRAGELGISLAAGVGRLLAERVGAYVREGDVDRRRQSELANAELEKLALYRPGGSITREDVIALVGEAVPASTWAFLDFVGARRAPEAAGLLDRLLAEAAPLPVLISQLHRRLRELVVVREHLDTGTKPAELVRVLKVQPFRAQKLAEQARAWQAAQLEAALTSLLELDLLSKGIASDGSPRSLSEERSRLALLAWLGEEVARRG